MEAKNPKDKTKQQLNKQTNKSPSKLLDKIENDANVPRRVTFRIVKKQTLKFPH